MPDKRTYIIAISAFVVGSVCAWYIQGLRLDKAVANHETFVAQTKAAGEVAQIKVDVITDKQIELKEVADVDYKTINARLMSDIKRLSGNRSRRSYTPAAPADTGRPDLACFDRTELEQAFRFLDDGISKLAQEGDQNTLRLSVGMKWAQGLAHRDNPSASQAPTTTTKEQ